MEVGKFPKCNLLLVVSKCAEQVCISRIAAKTSLAGIKTTFSSEPNQDGTTTITLSPNGSGKNGIPTGKDFYGILRAYVPAPGAIMKVKVERQ